MSVKDGRDLEKNSPTPALLSFNVYWGHQWFITSPFWTELQEPSEICFWVKHNNILRVKHVSASH